MNKKILLVLITSTLLLTCCTSEEDNRPTVFNAATSTSQPTTTQKTPQTQERIVGGLPLGPFFPPKILDSNGKTAYYFLESGKIRLLTEDGREVATGYRIHPPVNVVNGKPAMIASKDDLFYIIYGEEIKPLEVTEYELVVEDLMDLIFTEDEGRLTYVVYNQTYRTGHTNPEYNFKGYIVSGDNIIPGPENSYIYPLRSVAGKLTLYVLDKNTLKGYIISGGQEYGKEYDNVFLRNIYSVADVGGKIAFIAIKNNKTVVSYNGKEYGEEYYEVLHPFNVGGRLGYVAAEENSSVPQGIKKFIVYEGKEIGREYDTVDPYSEDGIAVVDNKIAYLATKGNRNIVVYDGKEYGLEYDNIYRVTSVGNKLCFTASIGYEYHIVCKDKKITVPAYKFEEVIEDEESTNQP